MQLSKEKPAVLPVLELPRLAMLRDERFLVGAHIITAFAALSIGALMGPFQAFHRAPAFVEAFPDATIPVFSYYYQALTAHGTLNALFFTFIFISGFSYFMVGRSLKRKLWSLPLAWVGFGAMLVGLLMMLFVLITDPQRSAVLYTFYPPLIAPPTFYLGLVLLVLGCWITAANVIVTANLWRKEHPGERLPLAVFAAVANHWMFIVSSIGVAVEVVFLLLPASLGIIDRTDPQLSRVLFWFFGHPLVYYWLVPAYISIYTVLPQQAGGKLFSDPLARVAFLMLMILALPTGVHHLFADPGVSEVNKAIHTFFTLLVSIPSFMTAFNIGATLERAGRDARPVWLDVHPEVDRSFGRRAVDRPDPFHQRRGQRNHQCVGPAQHHRPQHFMGAGPLPSDCRRPGGAHLHRHRLLVDSDDPWPRTVQQEDGPGAGLHLGAGHDAVRTHHG
jgi:cytochrome c oxidase subunit 1